MDLATQRNEALARLGKKIDAERQEKWDRRYLELAKHVSQWSKDPSTRVGCVLVNDNRVIACGYNGFPEGVADTGARLNEREVKYAMVVHAEMNCILSAGNKARGGALYVYPSFMIPCICADCCKNAIQAGIRKVVGYLPDESNPRVARWKDSISHAKTMCDEAGIEYYGLPEPQPFHEVQDAVLLTIADDPNRFGPE